MLESIITLPRLPSAPADFEEQCKARVRGTDQVGQSIRFMASHRLPAPMMLNLGRTIARCREGRLSPGPPASFKFGVLSGSTVDSVDSSLPFAAARHGAALDVTVPYGQVVLQAPSPNSVINGATVDGILLVLDHHSFRLEELSPEDGDGLAASAPDRAAILQTIPVPPLPTSGGYHKTEEATLAEVASETRRRRIVRLIGAELQGQRNCSRRRTLWTF